MFASLTPKTKDKIYNILAPYYIDAMKKGLSKMEQKFLAKKILLTVEKANTIEEIVLLFDSLSHKYYIFLPLALGLKEKVGKVQEDEVIGKLRNYISSLK